MIKAVLIDVDDTVFDFKKCADYALKKSANELGVLLPENMIDVFLPENRKLWIRLEKGEITLEELFNIRFDTIFSCVGVKTDGHVFESVFQKHLNRSHETVEGAEDALKALSEDFCVCVASNARQGQQQERFRLANSDKYISKYFVSGEIGASKPSAEFFEYCIRALKPLCKDEIIMFGDSLDADIKGAAAVGIRTVWFKRCDNTGSRLPTYTVKTLKEGAALIKDLKNRE